MIEFAISWHPEMTGGICSAAAAACRGGYQRGFGLCSRQAEPNLELAACAVVTRSWTAIHWAA